MKILDLYISRQFLTTLAMTLIGFVSIILIVDLIENLDRFIDNAMPFKMVLYYYFYALPWFLNIGLPMSMLISTVFSIGLLAKRNELTVIKSSGVSIYRVAAPLFIIGLLVSFLSFELDNVFVSKGNEKRYDIEQEYMKRRARKRYRNVLKNVFLQKQETIHIAINTYQINQQIGRGIAILTLEEGIIHRRIDALTISWIDSLEAWAVTNYSIREFGPAGEETDLFLSKNDTLMTLGFTPEDITQQSKSSDELNFRDLTDRIIQLKENGVDTTRWEVDRYFKVSFAFTNLIVVLFGLPLVVLKSKGGLSFGAGMGIFVIFIYYAFLKFGLSMGYKGIMDPWAAAWLGNVIFSLGGIILLFFAKK